MSNLLAITQNRIPAMSDDAIDLVRQIEKINLTLPQTDIKTFHTLHGGMYARTIMVPADTFLTGVVIKIATILIAQGDTIVYIGNETIRLTGYNVIPAGAHRKQAVLTLTDTYFTMILPTKAKTIKEAEEDFTDEVDILLSRLQAENNHTVITGE
jgi:hypothetical protein